MAHIKIKIEHYTVYVSIGNILFEELLFFVTCLMFLGSKEFIHLRTLTYVEVRTLMHKYKIHVCN